MPYSFDISSPASRSGAVTTAVALLVTAACSARRDDGLDPALRSRVEALVAEVRSEPTSEETVSSRTDVLWDWANAYALGGGQLPVMLPASVAAVRAAQALGRTPPAALMATLDEHVAELALKDEDPYALGRVALASSEPLVAGSLATFEQIYTVGSRPLEPGAEILLGMQLMTAFLGGLQIDDPRAENYVSVRCSDPEADFEKTVAPLPGIHGARLSEVHTPAFRLRGTSLAPGTTITLTYGDTSAGGPGLRVQPFATEELLFPIYLDLDGHGPRLGLRWPALRVIGASVAGVTALVPSTVGVGESFAVSVRAEDRWGNRATGPLPAWDVLLDASRVARIEGGGPAVRLAELRLAEPGVYRFDVVSGDGRFRARSNPVWVRRGGQRLLWGETHVHSAVAEGQGTPEEVYRYAREDSRLDFLGYSAHDSWMDDGEWAKLQGLAREASEPGRFAAFLGYEWTAGRSRGGHHNVFFRSPGHDRVPVQEAPLLPDLYRGLRTVAAAEDVLVIPHAHEPANWTRSDPELERLVEIYSMHGTFEWFANAYLEQGWEVGFVGASDDHRAKPGPAPGYPPPGPLKQRGGLAGVWAREPGADAIFDGLRSLRASATSGERIVLEATLNGRAMGTRQPASTDRRVEARVLGTAPIERIDVVRDGDVVFSQEYLTRPLEPDAWVEIGFESATLPEAGERVPRGFRTWKGSLEVLGARLVALRPAGLDNPLQDEARIDEEDPQRVLFSIDTRGRRDTVLLRLEGASPATRLVARLESTVGQGADLPPAARPVPTAESEVVLPLSALQEGGFEQPLGSGPRADRVTLRALDPDGALDRELAWTDLAEAGSRSYYYVRVLQLDGAQAWSSPFWVGDRPLSR